MTTITQLLDGLIEAMRAPRDQHENMPPIGADRVRRGMKSTPGRRCHGMKIDRFVRVFSRRGYATRVINVNIPALWDKHFKS